MGRRTVGVVKKESFIVCCMMTCFGEAVLSVLNVSRRSSQNIGSLFFKDLSDFSLFLFYPTESTNTFTRLNAPSSALFALTDK